jgi:probable rRNA maturation factor
MCEFTELIGSVLAAACARLQIPADSVAVNLSWLSGPEIRRLNAKHRGVDAVTDVLSFPALDIAAGCVPTRDAFRLDIDPETNKLTLGDIVICASRARAQARAYGHSLTREIAFLYLHGLLHLLGYDHEQDADAARMEALQTEILDEMGLKR